MIVVIGGSAAGITTAITARRYHKDQEIMLIRREEKVLIPCGIPYIFGTVGSADKNLIPDGVLDANKITLKRGDIQALDLKGYTVQLVGGEEFTYEKLVIATGSEPIVPQIPGVDLDGVFTVKKDVAYLGRLQERLKSAKNLVIIGGGFIGVEFADECNKTPDLNVKIVEVLPRCLETAYDTSICERAERVLKDRGVDIITGSKVVRISSNEDGKVNGVNLENGKELPADIVLLGIGAKPNTQLARAAGLKIGPTGAIQVDRHMATSAADVFAVGDCCEKVSFFDGRPLPLRLASIASMEARIAGANLFSRKRSNPGVIGVFSTAIGDQAFATAGLTEKAATDWGYDVVVGSAEAPNRHPGGMKGMAKLGVKLVFERWSGTILGGQAWGADSVGEIGNMLAACVMSRMTVDQIVTFQLGTHPALTASPMAYQIVNAAEEAQMARLS